MKIRNGLIFISMPFFIIGLWCLLCGCYIKDFFGEILWKMGLWKGY